MAIKTYNPTTPSQRQLALVDKGDLWKGRPHKSLTEGKSSRSGHDSKGHYTAKHRGGGHKKLYRIIDFKRQKFDVEGIIERIEYDPNRTAYIALVKYSDGTYAYVLAPQRVKAGDKIIAGKDVDIKPGNALPLANIPVGTIIHNVELKPGKGGQLARSAGSYVQLAGKDSGNALIKLRSGEVRLVNADCMATIGAVSNPDNQNQTFGKAGRKRWMGKKPHVRGVAMNPVDHPHGGGEGKTSGGRHPVSPTGKPAKGKKTRNNKSTNKFIVTSRHKKKKRK